MSPYVPIVTMVLLAVIFVGGLIALSLIVGPRRYNRSKYLPYESGTDSTPIPYEGGRFPIKYFVIAMLFLLFDIETVFIYPWAVAFGQLGLFAFIEMILFIVALLIVYVYVWRRHGLEWQ